MQKSEMHDYGYHYDDITPLTLEEALALFREGKPVLKLYTDNTEGYADSEEEIMRHAGNGGIFGLE